MQVIFQTSVPISHFSRFVFHSVRGKHSQCIVGHKKLRVREKCRAFSVKPDCFRRDSPQWARASWFMRFLDHTQWRTTVGRTPLNEWSARRRDLYPTTHNSHDKHHAPGGIRTHDLSRQAAVDLHLRPGGHRDRQTWFKLKLSSSLYVALL
jgi:hypothetical protein